MVTCRCKGGTNHLSHVIRPHPKESWEYVRVGLRHMSGLTLLFLGAGPGWGLTTFITKPCVFPSESLWVHSIKNIHFAMKFDISHPLLHWSGGR